MVVNMVVQMKERITSLVETNRRLSEELTKMSEELAKRGRERAELLTEVEHLRRDDRRARRERSHDILAQLQGKLIEERQRSAELLREKQRLLLDKSRDHDRFERAKRKLHRLTGELDLTLRERDQVASELNAATALLQDVGDRFESAEPRESGILG